MSTNEEIPFSLTPYEPGVSSRRLRRAYAPRRVPSALLPICQVMEQLWLDFDASNLITDALQAESLNQVPELYEFAPDVESSASSAAERSPRLDNGSYLELAIKLLLTCAEDLVVANKILNKPTAVTRSLNRAAKLKEETENWLRNQLPESPFTFQDCVALLENELRFQSLDQVSMPDIVGRSDELAAWIIDDPKKAKHVLSHYRSLFGRDSEEYVDESDDDEWDDEADDLDDTDDAVDIQPVSVRPRARA